MKHWRETEKLITEIRSAAAQGRRSVLATVVKVEGSAYRRPGAKLLIRDDATVAGNVSGGCLEADLVERAQAVFETGKGCRVSYQTDGPGDELWGLGLGCSGTIHLYLAPADTPEFVHLADDLGARLTGSEPFAVTTWLTEDGTQRVELTSGQSGGLVEDAEGARFTETLLPPARFVLCGAGDDSLPLAALADLAGFRVTVADHRSALLTPERFPAATLIAGRPDETTLVPDADDFVVLKTHSLEHDRGWYRRFAALPVRYLGLMGPQTRREQVLQGNPPAWPGFHGPVGLDLGADGAEQIAVSIVGELLAVYHGRTGGALKDRDKPIHERLD